MHRSTSAARRACAVGTTIALIGLTTGLGVFSASTAYAVDTDTAPTTITTTDAGAPADSSTPTDPSVPTDSPTPTDSNGSTAPATDQPTAPATDPAAPATTGTGSTPAKAPKAAVSAQAVASEAQIVGDPKVGVTLRADAPDIAGPTYKYAWSTDGGVTVASTSSVYVLKAADLGKRITVVITGANGDTATATTVAVTDDVAFATATTATSPRTIEITAGDTLDETFEVAKGSAPVSFAIGYSDPDSSDPTDPDDQPESYLPFDSVFDAATATLTGEVTVASTYDFTVVASNGTSTATQYVEVIVDPAAAVGVMASASDTSPRESFSNGQPSRYWIIDWDGSVVQYDVPADPDAEWAETDGAYPSVKQGASLWVDGQPVDTYGNSTIDYDGSDEYPLATVTSDHATDLVTPDEDSLSSKVTFPTASTHVLTVAEDGQSVSFPVTVDPAVAVAPVAAATPTTPKGQLAFTGSDTTGALPWGLAMLAAGAGLVGLRALRRRTQR